MPQPEKFLLKNLNPGKVKGFANTTLAYFLPFEKFRTFLLYVLGEGKGRQSRWGLCSGREQHNQKLGPGGEGAGVNELL